MDYKIKLLLNNTEGHHQIPHVAQICGYHGFVAVNKNHGMNNQIDRTTTGTRL